MLKNDFVTAIIPQRPFSTPDSAPGSASAEHVSAIPTSWRLSPAPAGASLALSTAPALPAQWSDENPDVLRTPAPAWSKEMVWYQIYTLSAKQPHRFTELTQWIPYVEELGANGILLSPIFQSTSHGYNTTDYFRIDPRLGTEADFEQFMQACHERGIRVALDGVINHVGEKHPFFQDFLANREESPYRDWFADVDFSRSWPEERINDSGEVRPYYKPFEQYWDLPELNKNNPEVVKYVTDVMDYWCSKGVDAWRVDAAYAISPEFSRSVNTELIRRHPEVFIFGEIIHGNDRELPTSRRLHAATQYEEGSDLPLAIAERNLWRLPHVVGRHWWFADSSNPMTFLDNHDRDRIAELIAKYGLDGRYNAVCATALMVQPGTPTIYYGSEWGISGEKTIGYDGDDAIRPHLPVPDVTNLTVQQRALRNVYRTLIQLRRQAQPWITESVIGLTHVEETAAVWQLTERGPNNKPYGYGRRLAVVFNVDADNWSTVPLACGPDETPPPTHIAFDSDVFGPDVRGPHAIDSANIGDVANTRVRIHHYGGTTYTVSVPPASAVVLSTEPALGLSMTGLAG